MSDVIYRVLDSQLECAVRGDGCYLIDRHGERYLDACGGAAVSCLGYSHSRIKSALVRQIEQLCYSHSSFFTNDPMEGLAEHLVGHAPQNLSKAYFVSGGSEAIESALKIARQYYVESGHPQKRWFISRRQSYHGATLAALSVGGHSYRRRYYRPLLFRTGRVSPAYSYRGQRVGESEDEYAQRLADELEREILHIGPDRVIGFVAETVAGAVLGAATPPRGYFERVRAICDQYGVLLILDEVMCGLGRTGWLHAFQPEGITPDILVLAKGLGGGYQPIGAVLISSKIVGAIEHGSNTLRHGFTYSGHALACTAALEVQRVIAEDQLVDRVTKVGSLLRASLEERLGNHPHVGDIRGRGLLLGLEFVVDRRTKKAFSPALALNTRVKAEALKRRLMVYPMGGTVDGTRGDHVLISPPFVLSTSQVDEITTKLGDAVEAAVRHVHVETH